MKWITKESRWRREHIAAFAEVSATQTDGLTLFQHRVLAEVAGMISRENFKVVAMNKEPGMYLLAPLGSKGAELFVYPNEAGIFGAKPYARYEDWDYRTPADLIGALVSECAIRAT